MRRLTDEQRDTVERNVALALYFAKRYMWRYRSLMDEIRSCAYMALVEAVIHHDPGRGKLSVLLAIKIKKAVWRMLRAEFRSGFTGLQSRSGQVRLPRPRSFDALRQCRGDFI